MDNRIGCRRAAIGQMKQFIERYLFLCRQALEDTENEYRFFVKEAERWNGFI
ncbi:hypothetical protein [Catenisphaera adipataccumulans]|jgi:hypothetical protein|uniref:Uncharacterized protein n=1 Tax=Catenisphaera adipataccumulans TaxID=700500 RepID=A0A7W8CYF2_9FIRM|nr:hypothetical protein [Catenisphaera adipataccumulans]MBB5182240.1 hypothetical protein [Catenisphaera adipataccumulans]